MTQEKDATRFDSQPISVRLGRHGRLVIPAALRRGLDVAPGDTLVAWLDGDRLILRSRSSVEQELWDIVRDAGGGLAEELIADRRNEARRELAEHD